MRATRVLPLLAAILFGLVPSAAYAQFGAVRGTPIEPVHRDQPVYYQADTSTYDRNTGIATLTGHVEFWQDNRVLIADKVTYDRNTDIAAAYGHVVLLDPDGQTVFSDYAELTGGMKDGIMKGVRALLAANGRLAANGGRRTEGHINELSRVVYSTCNLCAQDPTRAPLWQIRARSAVQDTENKMIEYRDAVIEIYGIPMFWLPYLTHPDPSAKRASGLLVPDIGYSKHLGLFTDIPYYWVINGQSDATLTPVLASKNGPALDVEYRQRFNNGTMKINGSLAYQRGDVNPTELAGAGGHIFADGQFAIDDTWRWGFDIDRASSSDYLRDFNIPNAASILTSQVYLEGFGQGSYSHLDVRAYQGLNASVITEKLPSVLPRYQYSFVGQPDPLGGRLSVDAGAFNVLRYQGTSTERASLGLEWNRPVVGRLGDVWNFTLHGDAAAYSAHGFDQQPNYGSTGSVTSDQAMPTAAVRLNWPMQRNAGSWGTQIVEPIVQLIAAPNGSRYGNTDIPDEDSLDLEFTDANLFSLNRFAGVDRLEGGMRANVGLHAAWYFPGGASVDGLVGEAFRLQKDTAFPVGSGLRGTDSDIVSHLSFTPSSTFDLTTRERFDRRTMDLRFADALASAGPAWLRLSGGYIFTADDPYALYDTPITSTSATPSAQDTLPRNEITLGATTKLGPWKLSLNGRRDLQQAKMVGAGVNASYENECFIFDVNFYRRYTSINNDHGDSTVLFQITLKTVGEFGFNAL